MKQSFHRPSLNQGFKNLALSRILLHLICAVCCCRSVAPPTGVAALTNPLSLIFTTRSAFQNPPGLKVRLGWSWFLHLQPRPVVTSQGRLHIRPSESRRGRRLQLASGLENPNWKCNFSSNAETLSLDVTLQWETSVGQPGKAGLGSLRRKVTLRVFFFLMKMLFFKVDFLSVWREFLL